MSTSLTPTTSEPPEVEIVDVDERIPTDDEVARQMQALGFAKLTETKIRLFNTLGAHQSGRGLLKTQRGLAFMSQCRLNETIEILHSLLAEGVDRPKRKKGQMREEAKLSTEDACRLAHEIAFASSKLTESQELMNKLRPTPGYAPPPLPGDKSPTPTFPAGAVVVGQNSIVQIHQGQNAPQKHVETSKVEA